MNKLLTSVVLFFFSACVFAQPLAADERHRIQTERTLEEARNQAREAACNVKFAISDCMHEARVQHRQTLNQLRQQELVLNTAERQQKALEKLAQLQEKAEAKKARELANLKD